jgi:membrane-associated protease RseP (regulator of RpoE activity)
MYLRMFPAKNSLRPLGAMVLAAGVTFLCHTAFAAGGQSGNVKSGSSHPSPGYLGIDIHDVSDDQAAAFKAQGQQRGAEIVGMDHDGPACQSGMQVHDVVLQMNGQAIDGEDQLRRLLRDSQAGKQVTFLLSRDGQQRTVTTQMADRDELGRIAWGKHYTPPVPEDSPAFTPRRGNSFFHGSPSAASSAIKKEAHSLLGTSMIIGSSYTGAKLEVMGPQLAEFFGTSGSAGLLVREVESVSPAGEAGLKAGDVVVRVNQQQVVNGSDWSKAIHENRGKQIEVVVLRDKKEKSLTLVPDSKKRSSLESGMSIEEFFGDSDQAEQTRATLAELAPMFDAMTASMHKRLEDVRATPETMRMMAHLEMWSAHPDFRRQIELAQQQVHAAAQSVREEAYSPEFEKRIDRMRTQMRDLIRLD